MLLCRTKRAFLRDVCSAENVSPDVIYPRYGYSGNVQTGYESMSTAKSPKRKRAKHLRESAQNTQSLVQHDGIDFGDVATDFNTTSALAPLGTGPKVSRCAQANSNNRSAFEDHLAAEPSHLPPSRRASIAGADSFTTPDTSLFRTGTLAVGVSWPEVNLHLNFPEYDAILSTTSTWDSLTGDANLPSSLDNNVTASTSLPSYPLASNELHSLHNELFLPPFHFDRSLDWTSSLPFLADPIPDELVLGEYNSNNDNSRSQALSEPSHSASLISGLLPFNGSSSVSSFPDLDDGYSSRLPASELTLLNDPIFFNPWSDDLFSYCEWDRGPGPEYGDSNTSPPSFFRRHPIPTTCPTMLDTCQLQQPMVKKPHQLDSYPILHTSTPNVTEHDLRSLPSSNLTWYSSAPSDAEASSSKSHSISGNGEYFLELSPSLPATPTSPNGYGNKCESEANTSNKENYRLSQSQISAKFASLEGGAKHHSPVLIVNEVSNETHPDVQDVLAKANQPFTSSNSDSLPSKGKPFMEPEQVKWEHTFVLSDSFQRAGDREPKQSINQRIGRRSGPLLPGSKKKASLMRKVGACWHCWIFKVPCSEGDVCQRCSITPPSPLTGSLCCRAHFRDFTCLFFPPQTLGQFHGSSLHELISKKVTCFTDNTTTIEIKSGPTYPPIHLVVNEFQPRDQDFLALPQLVTDETSKKSRIEVFYTPPFALNEPTMDMDMLKDKCLEHIRLVIKGQRNAGEVAYGETSPISWRVLQAVSQYQRACPGNGLLRKAMMLYAMEYFMTRSLLFTDESAARAMRSLTRPTQLNYVQNLSSRLVSRQVKSAMYMLLDKTTAEVLEGLEKELRSRLRSSWATSLCIILVLSMYAEMVQVATDVRLVRAIGENPSASRDTSIVICRKLDDIAIAQCSNIFHAVYRTSKPSRGPRNERGFNPIRDGLEANDALGIDQDMVDLADQIRHIICDYKGQLADLSRPPSLDNRPDPLANHMKFRKRNSGRLVAKFLQSIQ